jgi:hypothetical protein
MSSGPDAGGRDQQGSALSYQLRLARELAATGIKGATRRRILAEIEDHFACDPAADLGDPGALARQFADELGTRRARRAAFGAFAALAAAGALFAVAVFAVQAAGGLGEHVHQSAPTLGLAGIALSAVGAQVALVAGVLACMRALRRGREQILNRDETIVLVRRASVALTAGLLTMAGLALTAIGFKGHIPGWWSTLALCSAGAGALALAAGAPAVLMARSLQPRLEGSAGDLSDDLRGLMPAGLDAGGLGFALGVACVVALVIALAGVVQDDPFDGLLRGLADGLACTAGYLVLGRYLGIRRTTASSARRD